MRRRDVALGSSIDMWSLSIASIANHFSTKEPSTDGSTMLQDETVQENVSVVQIHTFVFDDDAFEEAILCSDPFDYLPYRECQIERHGEIIATYEHVGSRIEIAPDLEYAHNLMSFIVNRCAPNLDGDYGAVTPPSHVSPALNSNISGEEVVSQQGAEFASRHRIKNSQTNAQEARKVFTPHIRKAHKRRQHYGPKNSMVKIVTIHETLVTGEKAASRSNLAVQRHRVRLV